MSCQKCVNHPVIMYINIGNGIIQVKGCDEHLLEMLKALRKGLNETAL